MLRKIFSPFIKIWNWIKETAWIQPLLIVGIVFGIIFSISPIVKACSAENSDAEYNFYANREKSLENIFTDYENCEAAELLDNIDAAYSSFIKNGFDAAETKDAIKALPADKFFLMFYSKECDACKNSADAFEYLADNWGKDYFTTANNQKFNMYTINTLEEVKNEDDKDELAFPELLENIPEFFETASSAITSSPYYIKGKIDKVNLENFQLANQDKFPVPTLLLIDFTSAESRGYEQLMFTIPGKNGNTGAADKAMTLMDCWNGTGEFKFDN